jgi:hypothetical protein
MSEKILSYRIEAVDEASPVFESAGEAMREAFVKAPAEAAESLGALNESLDAALEKAAAGGEAMGELSENLAQGLEAAISSMAENVLSGTLSAGDALKGFLEQSLSALASFLSQQAVQFLLNSALKGLAKKKEAVSTSSSNLAQVFSGQFAAMSQAPFPVNLTAPAVAAAMLAAAQAGTAAAGAAGAATGAAAVPAMAEGGFVPMLPGADASRDSVHALLQPGEFVVPAAQAPLAAEIFGGRPGRGRFQEGGLVRGGGDSPAAAPEVRVFVLPADPSVLGPMMEAMSRAVERFGFRLAASELAA